jgi:hypothetical protein
MIVDGLEAEGKDPKTAKVVDSGGQPTTATPPSSAPARTVISRHTR